MNPPQEFCFFYGRHAVQQLLIVQAVVHVSIDRKIPYSERGQVLEEVCSLTRIDTIIGQPRFHDDAGRRYVRPFYGNTQPCIAASQRPGPTNM